MLMYLASVGGYNEETHTYAFKWEQSFLTTDEAQKWANDFIQLVKNERYNREKRLNKKLTPIVFHISIREYHND